MKVRRWGARKNRSAAVLLDDIDEEIYDYTSVRLIVEQIQLVRKHVVLQDMIGVEKVFV